MTAKGQEVPLNYQEKKPGLFDVVGYGEYELSVSTPAMFGGDAFGAIVVQYSKEADSARVRSINSTQALSGQGVGNRMYAQAMIAAKDAGLSEFRSDYRVSNAATKSWESLGRKLPGLVKRNTDTTNDGMQNVGTRSVFSVNLKQVSRSDLERIAKGG